MKLIDLDALKIKLDGYAGRDCEYPIDYCDVKYEIENAPIIMPIIMQWVSVKNEKPPGRTYVLLTDGRYVYKGCYVYGRFLPCEDSDDGNKYCNITHWMQCPEPPGKQQAQ